MTRTATRPKLRLWKHAAKSLRSSFHRAFDIVDWFAPWRHDPLLPPAHLRIYYYRTWKPAAFARACQNARGELEIAGLQRDHRVLDIGSGIGNLPIGLIGRLEGTYDGIDVHREAVAWCRRAITPRYPRFNFHHADVANTAYNPGNRPPAATYRFPFSDGSFDVIFLASVYTHLLPEDATNYIHEVARLLAPNGFCVATYFLLDEEREKSLDAGQGFIPLAVRHSSGVCRLNSADSPESAVAFDERFIERVHREAGLRIRDIRRGQWWRGVPHDQDVVVTIHRPSDAGT